MEGPHSYLEAPTNASRALPSPMNAIGSPVNALGSPYRVIASSLGSHPVALSSAPGMNFMTHASPQVGMCTLSLLQFSVQGGKVPRLERELAGGEFGHLESSAVKNVS